MCIINAGCVVVILFATLSVVGGLRCYVCDSRSVIGYYDAEKDCNTDRSLQQCPDAKHKACMIEAFRHDAGSVYHIVKRCLVECPAFVNGSAEHTRCCAKDACNDVISIDVIDHRTASDLVADVREHAPQQPAGRPLPGAPPVLTDGASHRDDNVVEVERADNDHFQRRLPPAQLWTLPPPVPPLPPPSSGSTPRSTTERPDQRLGPPTETTATPATPRRDRRPLPGGSGGGGTQWWKSGLRSSSTSQRSTTSAAIIVFTAVTVAVRGLLPSASHFHIDLYT